MKICLLCFKLSKNSGSGMDVYAYNLVSFLKDQVHFSIIEYNVNSTLDWFIKEFIVPQFPLQIMKSDADIYHAVNHVGAKAALLAMKSPIIVTVHDLIPNALPATEDYYKMHPKFRRWLNPWYWRFYRRCDHLIATSETTKRDIIRILKINPEKISVVHYGVDHQKFQPVVRKDYHSPKTILHIGPLSHGGRGIYNLIQAFHLVTEKMEDVNLLICGRGKALPVIIKMVNDLGIKDRVKFLGFVPDEKLSYYYRLSDVFVLPSHYGFHLMYLDAMASGLPVIAGNIGVAKEYVEDAGLLVRPWDNRQIAGAILDILTNRSMYVEMSKKAIHRAKCFSWERMAKETMDVYKTVLSK